jgi:hypothetical protein
MTFRFLLILAAAGALAGPDALAQRRPNLGGGDPVLIAPSTETAFTGRPLTPEQMRKLSEARTQRMSGRHDRARAILQSLLQEVPHHPGLLSELISVYADREEWPAIERLARAERTALRDSVLLGHELVSALAQQRKPRDAALVAVEVWSAAPAEQDWALAILERTSGADDRAARDALRRAAEKRPHRADLARGLARLDARAGDVRPALRSLGAADRAEGRWRLRWGVAEEMLAGGTARDTAAAGEVLLDLSSDPAADPSYRASAAQRFWEIATARAEMRDGAARVRKALADVPPAKWSPELRLKVARELRQTGRTAEVRELLAPTGGRDANPDFELERVLTDLRDGPPERVLSPLRELADHTPEAAFRYAEALFFAGQADSAHAWYVKAADDPAASNAGAALERLYLLEEPTAAAALPAFGRIAYAEWRGDRATFQSISDSLYRSLPRGAAWAQAAMLTAAARENDARAALQPLLAVADSLPGDRLAPLARQRAGDLYRTRLGDDVQAIHQYEECLARYPRAWNAAEVRRTLETMRKAGTRKTS